MLGKALGGRVPFLLGLGVWLTTVSAQAQQAPTPVQPVPPLPPSDQPDPNQATARQLFQQGDGAYRAGRYQAAIELFTEAYRLSSRPLILFAIANAQERLGRVDEAIATLERYLPNAGNETAVIESRIRGLRERVQQERETRERQQREAEARARAEAEARARQAQGNQGPPAPVRGIVVSSVGVAVAAVGGVFGGLALGSSATARQSCATTNMRLLCQGAAEGPIGEASRNALIADIGIGVGGALVVAGVVLIVVDVTGRPANSPATRTTWWRPTGVSVLPGTTSLRWSF